jgi:fructose-1,6-bisphosphatase/inositol monophosphatase family enzyme
MTDKTIEDRLVDILISLELVVKKAGELMLELRKNATVNDKFATGIKGIDMVTNADLAVQEAILSEMAKTELVDCKLFAEENTESVEKFKNTNGFTLSLDPIDGTAIYASTGRFFCTIIYLRKGEELLYTLYYYPAFGWGRRITKNGVEDFGSLPKIETKPGLDLSKTIAYTFKGPEAMDKETYDKLIGEGYNFKCLADITSDSGSTALFFLDQVAGYVVSAPNPHDGLGALYYSQKMGFKIYSTLDFTKLDPSDHGPHLRGWYLALRK